MKNQHILLVIVANALMLIMVLPSFLESLLQRKKALFILPVWTGVKIFFTLWGSFCVVFFFPDSLYFIVFIFSIVLLSFSIDIIIEDEGFFCGSRFFTWQNIKEISNHRTHLLIRTLSGPFDRKAFWKIFWRMKLEDIERIQSLFREKGGK